MTSVMSLICSRAIRRERFECIDRPLACGRRHDQNDRVVHRDSFLREGHAVRQSFGMRNDFTRSLLSYAMKALFHLSNSGCCAGKMIERARFRLGLAQVYSYR